MQVFAGEHALADVDVFLRVHVLDFATDNQTDELLLVDFVNTVGADIFSVSENRIPREEAP